jgi:PhnB protein
MSFYLHDPYASTQAVLPAGVVPHLVVRDAIAAIGFYEIAFAATELFRMMSDDGQRVLHASLAINGGQVYLCDDFPEYHDGEPIFVGGRSPVLLHLAVQDADAAFGRAVSAGASVRLALQDMFWGDRYGQVQDPFGQIWSIASPVRPA